VALILVAYHFEPEELPQQATFPITFAKRENFREKFAGSAV
jgi:hypothetical protein